MGKTPPILPSHNLLHNLYSYITSTALAVQRLVHLPARPEPSCGNTTTTSSDQPALILSKTQPLHALRSQPMLTPLHLMVQSIPKEIARSTAPLSIMDHDTALSRTLTQRVLQLQGVRHQ